MESKLSLYNRMMSTLNELKPDFVETASLAVQKRALLMEEVRTSTRIGLYSFSGNEVKTDFLFTEADKNRKELYYPVVDRKREALTYCRVMDLSQLENNGTRILKPVSGGGLRDVNTLDVIIAPGVAFDLHGARIGFEGGWFDKCLKGFSGTRIALAYDFQVVSEMPMSVREKKVDWIVTELRTVQC